MSTSAWRRTGKLHQQRTFEQSALQKKKKKIGIQKAEGDGDSVQRGSKGKISLGKRRRDVQHG